MPELPEVETVKNRLAPFVLGKTIKDIDIRYPKYECLKEIKGETIEGLRRRGKYLIFILADHYVVSHLRMEGKYFVEKEERYNKHDLVKFDLGDYFVYYNDVRRFGVFDVFKKSDDIDNLPPLNKVGVEPFNANKEYLYKKLKSLRIPIKTALLDQSIISGLGNIYVDEVLFKSRINPFMSASNVTIEDCDRIIKHSIDTLNESIEAGGSTIKSFGSINGEAGHFQGHLLVHLRENERCYNCSGIIIKGRCGGRGTYYCPSCQRLVRGSKYIAVTGGFSSGKSTALKMIGDLGYHTYSTDQIYNDLFMNSKEMIREIDKAFNTHNKNKLKEIVFNSSSENDKLKTITHKYVMKTLFKMLEYMGKETVIKRLQNALTYCK